MLPSTVEEPLRGNDEVNTNGEPDALKGARPVRKGTERKGLATTPRSQSTLHTSFLQSGRFISAGLPPRFVSVLPPHRWQDADKPGLGSPALGHQTGCKGVVASAVSVVSCPTRQYAIGCESPPVGKFTSSLDVEERGRPLET